MQRRTFLSSSLWAGAGLAAGGRRIGGAPAVAVAGLDLRVMAERVLAAKRGDVADLALEWAAAGATFRDLLGVSYLAGLREINPSLIGGQVHALMMVASAAETGAVLRGRQKLLPALFNLDRVKRSQARDAGSSRGDWTLKEAPAPVEQPLAATRKELAAAMTAWDEEAGDRAVVTLHEAVPMDVFFEELWPWAVRDFRVIGHKAIFAAQTYRALQEIGWRYGRDAVRSLALGVLDGNPYDTYSADESKEILALFEHNRERAERFPAAWHTGRTDPQASFALLGELRTADAEGAADAVLATLRKGVGAGSIWDGLRLHAFEQTMQKPSIAGVHTVTSVNALHRIAQISNDDRMRRLCVLQAASWLTLFRPLLADRARTERDVAIDGLCAAGKAVADPFATDNFGDGAARAVGQVEKGGGAVFAGRALDVLARKAENDHDYKYTVAALEEIAAAHPRFRPLLAGAAMGMLRTEKEADGAVFRAVAARLAE